MFVQFFVDVFTGPQPPPPSIIWEDAANLSARTPSASDKSGVSHIEKKSTSDPSSAQAKQGDDINEDDGDPSFPMSSVSEESRRLRERQRAAALARLDATRVGKAHGLPTGTISPSTSSPSTRSAPMVIPTAVEHTSLQGSNGVSPSPQLTPLSRSTSVNYASQTAPSSGLISPTSLPASAPSPRSETLLTQARPLPLEEEDVILFVLSTILNADFTRDVADSDSHSKATSGGPGSRQKISLALPQLPLQNLSQEQYTANISSLYSLARGQTGELLYACITYERTLRFERDYATLTTDAVASSLLRAIKSSALKVRIEYELYIYLYV